MSSNIPAQPSTAFSYISRSFRQTTPYIVGALRLLADTFSAEEINTKGWGLYAEFRPYVEGWGKRGEVRCGKILGLRKAGKRGGGSTSSLPSVVRIEACAEEKHQDTGGDVPDCKRPRGLSLEEYEAVLDQDTTFDDVDLNFDDPQ